MTHKREKEPQDPDAVKQHYGAVKTEIELYINIHWVDYRTKSMPVISGPWATLLTWENKQVWAKLWFTSTLVKIPFYLPFDNERGLAFEQFKPLYPRILCSKFGWNWRSGSTEKDVLMSALHFCSFVIISSWKSIPFTQGCFVPSLVEIFPMVLEKKVEKFTIQNF